MSVQSSYAAYPKQQQQQQQQKQLFGSGGPLVTPDAMSGFYTTNAHLNDWQHMTRTVEHYERGEQIGEGTYGQVYRAVCKDSGRPVALKKMRQFARSSGMPQQLIREIKILKELQHPNLLQMIEVITSKGAEHLDHDDPITTGDPAKKKRENELQEDAAGSAREKYKGNLFLVLEYVTHDLTGLMDVAYQFSPVQIKSIFQQLLKALAYMHEHKYVHRDIKSSNILLDSQFHLKLADFGLARSLEPPLLEQMEQQQQSYSCKNDLTNKVITLWYRPPEILLGTVHYGCAVDVWSAGCILAELLTGKPLASGKSELDQLTLLTELTGTPDADTWKHLMVLKRAKTLDEAIPIAAEGWRGGRRMESKLRTKFGPTSSRYPDIPDTAVNLLEKLLEWDPRKRLTAANALQNRYFWSQPVAPENPAELGFIQVAADGHFHEFQTKQKRRQAKAEAELSRGKATQEGSTAEEAQHIYDNMYKSIMKKAAQEGLASNAANATDSPSEPRREHKGSSSEGRRLKEERHRSKSKSRSEKDKYRSRNDRDSDVDAKDHEKRHKRERPNDDRSTRGSKERRRHTSDTGTKKEHRSERKHGDEEDSSSRGVKKEHRSERKHGEEEEDSSRVMKEHRSEKTDGEEEDSSVRGVKKDYRLTKKQGDEDDNSSRGVSSPHMDDRSEISDRDRSSRDSHRKKKRRRNSGSDKKRKHSSRERRSHMGSRDTKDRDERDRRRRDGRHLGNERERSWEKASRSDERGERHHFRHEGPRGANFEADGPRGNHENMMYDGPSRRDGRPDSRFTEPSRGGAGNGGRSLDQLPRRDEDMAPPRGNNFGHNRPGSSSDSRRNRDNQEPNPRSIGDRRHFDGPPDSHGDRVRDQRGPGIRGPDDMYDGRGPRGRGPGDNRNGPRGDDYDRSFSDRRRFDGPPGSHRDRMRDQRGPGMRGPDDMHDGRRPRGRGPDDNRNGDMWDGPKGRGPYDIRDGQRDRGSGRPDNTRDRDHDGSRDGRGTDSRGSDGWFRGRRGPDSNRRDMR